LILYKTTVKRISIVLLIRMVRKTSYNDLVAKLQALNISWDVTEQDYKNMNTNHTTKFRCILHGVEWEGAQIKAVISKKKTCHECRMTCNMQNPAGEAMSIFILETLLGKQFKKTRRVLPSRLELDGYNEELKLAIEYNGSQHYIENKSFFHKEGGSFEAQQQRDILKQKECVDLGIELIIVHYKINTFENIRGYLESELVRLNIPFESKHDWVELKKNLSYARQYRLREYNAIVEIVESKNGKCLSTNYIDRLDPMRFKCEVDNHPEFEKTPADIRRDVWCNYCAHNAPQSTESINEEFKQYGIQLVSDYLPGSHTVQTFACANGHVFDRQLDNMRRTVKIGKGCIVCDDLVRRIPVYQYTLDGNYVGTFETLMDVPNLSSAKSVNAAVFRNAVRECMIGKSNHVSEFIWSFLAPSNNRLVRFRNTRAAYNDNDLEFIDKYELAITAPTKKESTGSTTVGATKKKNLPVIKYDLNTNEIVERYNSVPDAIKAGNKMRTVYNNCAEFGKHKSTVNISRKKQKQVFMYEDDNQIIPWVSAFP
jgi:NUMOD1 domain